MEMKGPTPEDRTALPQQPQQSTNVNSPAEKGNEMAQPTAYYGASEITLQDQDMTTIAAPTQPTMLPTNLHLVKVMLRKYPSLLHKVQEYLRGPKFF
ncbi:16464_t:CDS:2 [Gigaspora margarita]|uniref:16464_t:CDS:1 n=1 Tax=Gigaspora margarita TaxID=4874 RepID=A0ABN7VFR9_GIGMA|nr:16464_t:CDS:2 [Gigaspora margarita]